MFGSESV